MVKPRLQAGSSANQRAPTRRAVWAKVANEQRIRSAFRHCQRWVPTLQREPCAGYRFDIHWQLPGDSREQCQRRFYPGGALKPSGGRWAFGSILAMRFSLITERTITYACPLDPQSGSDCRREEAEKTGAEHLVVRVAFLRIPGSSPTLCPLPGQGWKSTPSNPSRDAACERTFDPVRF
jgi:hypothetical protein